MSDWAAKVLDGVPRWLTAGRGALLSEAEVLAAIAKLGAGDGLVERLQGEMQLYVEWRGKAEAAEAERDALRAKVARLEGALEGVTSAAQQMLSEAQKTGVLDNILPEIFPDAKTRGTRADMGLKQLDAARNNLRAHISTARAALTDGGKDE